jgi:uncharacterized protein (TIGR03086 family)
LIVGRRGYGARERSNTLTADTDRSLDVLSRALDQTEGVLAQVSRDQLTDPTPCSDWDLSALVAHLVADTRNFALMALGDSPDWGAQPTLPDDWTAEFRSGADELLTAWHSAGDSASAQSIDMQTAELAVHTWDVVQALGVDVDLDDEVAQRGYDLMSGALDDDNRGEAFGPPVPCADDAPVYDRLVAFAGRSPR